MTEQTDTTKIEPKTEEGRRLLKLQDERLRVRVELLRQQTVIIRAVVRAIEEINPIDHKVDLPDYNKLEKLYEQPVLNYDEIESLVGDLLFHFGLKTCT